MTTEREMLWDKKASLWDKQASHWQLHISVRGNSPLANDTITLFSKVRQSDEEWEVEYWRVVPHENDWLRGEWVELCTAPTLEEAKQVAENAARLNLGGWPP